MADEEHRPPQVTVGKKEDLTNKNTLSDQFGRPLENNEPPKVFGVKELQEDYAEKISITFRSF